MKKNRIFYMIALVMFSISLVSFGVYAIWNLGEGLFTNENTITSGQIIMSFSEKNEILLNKALPMKDEDGKKLDEYFDFSVSTYIKTNVNDNTSRKSFYNVLLEKLNPPTGTVSLEDEEIKVFLTELDASGNEIQVLAPTTINKLRNYVLTSGEEEFKNGRERVTKNFRLRVWIDFNVNAGKFLTNYSYNFRINVNNQKNESSVMNASEFALAKVGTGGLEQINHVADSTLQISQAVTEYRYRGANDNVDNYVMFNGKRWRIIGVIPTDDGTGNIENRFKIIDTSVVQGVVWDSNTSNNWAMPSTLNNHLNTTLYNNMFNTLAKSMVAPAKYYLGGYSSDTLNLTADVVWSNERKISGSDYYYNGNPNHYIGKVGIMNASDYGYAASSFCSDTITLNNYNNATCVNNNWLYSAKKEWLITQRANKSTHAFYINELGGIDSYYTDSSNTYFRNVVTLASNVVINGGSGVIDDEYLLGF